jgi:hypothetical protein
MSEEQKSTDPEVVTDDFEFIVSDGIPEVNCILDCIKAEFSNGEPVFDAIDRGRMTKLLLKHIRRL